MIIIGLDLSLTSAGIAILRDGELAAPLRSVGHKGSDGDDYRHRSRRVRSQVRAVMACLCDKPGEIIRGNVTPFDLAVLEGPLMHGPAQAYAFDRAALWHGVFGALDAKHVPVAVINPATLKVWWTGDGTATKLRMLDTARARVRPAVSDHDQADALALAMAGAYHLGDKIPFEPSERQLGALAKVEWPAVVSA